MSQDLNAKAIIGGDETGVGDYFSPLVVAVAYVRPEQFSALEALGVRDSKALSNDAVRALYPQLKVALKNAWSAQQMSQAQYNLLTSKVKLNAHELKTLLYLKALAKLAPRVDLSTPVIIDQYAAQHNFDKYVVRTQALAEAPHVALKISLVEKGESKYLAIAAASIIARGILLELMAKQNETWNFKFPLGASNLVIEAGKRFVKLHQAPSLRLVAKLSFKTTLQVLKETSGAA